jgi:hypothetical protein
VRTVTGRRTAWTPLASALVSVLAFPAPARATDCARPDLLDAVPPDGAKVPQNASLFAHYEPSADYGNEDVVLTPAGGTPEVVKVTWDGTQGLLAFAPESPLPAGSYTIEWPALRGLNTSALGKGAIVHFTVGDVDDLAPPDFAGLTGVAWDLERETNDCTDSLENRMVFRLSLAPAGDDGGRAGLTLVVFQTAGSGSTLDGGSVPVLSTAMPAAGDTVVVKLPVSDATGHVCFAAIARDLTGKISSSGATTVCAETTAPPFFRGCATAPPGGRGGFALAFVLAALAWAARRRARAR